MAFVWQRTFMPFTLKLHLANYKTGKDQIAKFDSQIVFWNFPFVFRTCFSFLFPVSVPSPSPVLLMVVPSEGCGKKRDKNNRKIPVSIAYNNI